MFTRDRKQSENSGVTLLSQETTTTSVSEFQDIEEEPNSPPPNYSPRDVIFELTDETKHDCDEEQDHFDLNRCECKSNYKLRRNNEHLIDCFKDTKRTISSCCFDSRNTIDSIKCRRNIGCKTQSESLIKKVKCCGCSSNEGALENTTDDERSDNGGCTIYDKYQDLMNKYIDVIHRCDELVNTFQKQPAENIRLRKMYIKLKKLFVALAVVNIIVIIIVIAIMPLMIVTFKLTEKSDHVSIIEDDTQNGDNEPSVQKQYSAVKKLFIKQTVFCVPCEKLRDILREISWRDVRESINGCCFTDLMALFNVFVQERDRHVNEEIYPYIRRQIAHRLSNTSDSSDGTSNEETYPPINPPINDNANAGLLAVIDQLTSKRRSVIHLKSNNQAQKAGNRIGWSPRFAPQGDLTMGSDGCSIRVTTGGLYFIYSHVQFSRNANVTQMRNVTLGFTLTRTSNDGVIIDKEDVQQRCMFRDGTLEHPSTIQTVMLLEGDDKISVSVPEHQQRFLSRASGTHAFGMFEL